MSSSQQVAQYKGFRVGSVDVPWFNGKNQREKLNFALQSNTENNTYISVKLNLDSILKFGRGDVNPLLRSLKDISQVLLRGGKIPEPRLAPGPLLFQAPIGAPVVPSPVSAAVPTAERPKQRPSIRCTRCGGDHNRNISRGVVCSLPLAPYTVRQAILISNRQAILHYYGELHERKPTKKAFEASVERKQKKISKAEVRAEEGKISQRKLRRIAFFEALKTKKLKIAAGIQYVPPPIKEEEPKIATPSKVSHMSPKPMGVYPTASASYTTIPLVPSGYLRKLEPIKGRSSLQKAKVQDLTRSAVERPGHGSNRAPGPAAQTLKGDKSPIRAEKTVITKARRVTPPRPKSKVPSTKPVTSVKYEPFSYDDDSTDSDPAATRANDLFAKQRMVLPSDHDFDEPDWNNLSYEDYKRQYVYGEESSDDSY